MKKHIAMEDFSKRKLEDEEEEQPMETMNLPNKTIEKKFLEDRIVFLWGPVDDTSARDVVSKLIYLERMKSGEKITLYLNSPGGIVSSGMAILDTMKLIGSPVSVICTGLAASMGAILLSAGEKGERYIFPYGEVMLHQPSVGMIRGAAVDIEIHAKQIIKTKEISARIISENCGQKYEKVLKDFDRDYWMDAREAIKFGIVDKIYSFT